MGVPVLLRVLEIGIGELKNSGYGERTNTAREGNRMAVTTGRKPSSGVKRTPAQVVKMVATRAPRLGSNHSREDRIEAADEVINIVTDYRDQLRG